MQTIVCRRMGYRSLSRPILGGGGWHTPSPSVPALHMDAHRLTAIVTAQVCPLLLPYLVAVTLTALACWPWINQFQLLLEFLTIGGWNPAVLSWSQNPPLWFASTVLTWHYVSPAFLRFTNGCTGKQLVGAFFALYALRSGIGMAALLSIPKVLAKQGAVHVWAPVQVSRCSLPQPPTALQQPSEALCRPLQTAVSVAQRR